MIIKRYCSFLFLIIAFYPHVSTPGLSKCHNKRDVSLCTAPIPCHMPLDRSCVNSVWHANAPKAEAFFFSFLLYKKIKKDKINWVSLFHKSQTSCDFLCPAYVKTPPKKTNNQIICVIYSTSQYITDNFLLLNYFLHC